MHILIKSTLHTLENTNTLLSSLSNSNLTNKSIPPYYSSIGSHIRHILDFYDCILMDANTIDLTARKRQIDVETNCDVALRYLKDIEEKLKNINTNTLNRTLMVTDDLGLGNIEIQYTFAAILARANSHAIHHYAIINYILDRLKIIINDESFGYNPTTPRQAIS